MTFCSLADDGLFTDFLKCVAAAWLCLCETDWSVSCKPGTGPVGWVSQTSHTGLLFL